jgi:hypothetical protein
METKIKEGIEYKFHTGKLLILSGMPIGTVMSRLSSRQCRPFHAGRRDGLPALSPVFAVENSKQGSADSPPRAEPMIRFALT